MKVQAKITVLALTLIPILLLGCASFSELGEKISGIFSSENSSEKSDESKTGTSISLNLKTPDSYEKAYTYRTDTADKTIVTFIKTKNVDALRTTSPDEYVKTICAKINENAKNDFEKVKLAHDVICLLVSYDAANFWTNTVPEQNWQNVVKTKMAVCEGYANLFQRFMQELKISSQKVSGFARGVGNDISNENPKNSNHAWNIVKIENCWYLVDCTWDSGYMSGKKSVQAYTTDYLFLKPEHFIYTHFPTIARNQLLTPAFSSEEFLNLPDFRPKIFELAGESLSFIKKQNTTSDFFEMNCAVKADWKLSFSVNKQDGSELKNRIFSETRNGQNVTRINFPEAGKYAVRVFYTKVGDKTGHSCGEFIVNAKSGNDIKYPTLYSTSVKNASIVSPRQSPIAEGQSVHFEFAVEGKNFVAVIIGRNFNILENDGNGNFTGDVEIPKGTKQVSIGLSSTGKGSWETFAVYEVK